MQMFCQAAGLSPGGADSWCIWRRELPVLLERKGALGATCGHAVGMELHA